MTEAKEKIEGVRDGKPMTGREKLYLSLIALTLLALVVMLIARPRPQTDAAPAGNTAADAAAEPKVVYREVEKLVEVEKTIEVETIRDGLRDMGVLLTGEYYFTDIISYSSDKKLFKTDFVLPFTETSYTMQYDGVVNAGVDLSTARIEKDDEHRQITVFMNKAAIQSTEIDFDSFRLIGEKAGIGNPVSAQDFNNSLRELKASAEEKAIARGLLERSEENAEAMIRQFIGSLPGVSEYSLKFITH